MHTQMSVCINSVRKVDRQARNPLSEKATNNNSENLDKMLHQLARILSDDFETSEKMLKKFQADTEVLIDLKNEPWDNLSFYTVESRRNPLKFQSTFSMIAPLLWHACRCSGLGFVSLVVEQGADANSSAETRLHSTPLMVACAKRKRDVVKFLIEHAGADVNKLDANGDNCLFYAVRHNQNILELVEYLVSMGAAVNLINKNNKGLLDLATMLDDSLVLEYLIETHGHVLPVSSKESSLMIAAYRCKRRCILFRYILFVRRY